jgi:predicted SprT family Zn-dependent metalloprotease
MSLLVKEIVVDGKTIGYQVKYYKYDNNTALDIPFDVFETLYECKFKYYNIIYDKLIRYELVGDKYVPHIKSKCVSLDIEDASDPRIEIYLSKFPKPTSREESTENLCIHRFLVCKRELADLNIPLSIVDSVAVNSRFERAWGRCRRLGNKFRIELSYKLMKTATIEGIDMVMYHELLHTCIGCFNHGSLWKQYAFVVCQAKGIHISRLTSADELGVDIQALLEQGYFACQCIDCGNVVTRKSECRFINHPEWYSCGKCGGSFVRIS